MDPAPVSAGGADAAFHIDRGPRCGVNVRLFPLDCLMFCTGEKLV